jgi:hypothetical protein
VLSQVQESQERVVTYFSKTLSRAEKNYSAGITGHREDRTLTQIPLRSRVPSAQRLRPNVATEFQESGRTDSPLGSASPGVQLNIGASLGAQAHQRGCMLKDTMSRGMHPLPEGRTTGRQPESMNHRCYRRGWLGPSRLKEGAVE